MDVQDVPKVRADGTYDPVEVILYAHKVGDTNAAITLNIPIHRIRFFQSKMREDVKNQRVANANVKEIYRFKDHNHKGSIHD